MCKFLGLAALLFLGACASMMQPKWAWYKPDETQEMFNMDMANCRNEAMPYVSTSPMQSAMVINNCMIGKGWVKRSNAS